MPPLDPDVADLAPSDPVLTVYHHEHAVTYMRMLDADTEGADWRELARTVLDRFLQHQSRDVRNNAVHCRGHTPCADQHARTFR
jgi:hypothetical protein